MANQLTAEKVRLVTFTMNSRATASAQLAVIKQFLTDGFWEQVTPETGLTLNGFIKKLNTGIQVPLIINSRRTDQVLKLREQARERNLEQVFEYFRPQFISGSRINYCERCGTYHENRAVFSLKSLGGDEDDIYFDPDENSFGVSCDNCGAYANIFDDALVKHSWGLRNTGVGVYSDYDSINEFVEDFTTHCMKHYEVPLTQLSMLGLDFLSYMSEEDHEALTG